MPKYEMNLDHLAEVEAYVTAPTPVGPSIRGTRLIFPVVGGTVTGPRLDGKIQAFGADWGLIRPEQLLRVWTYASLGRPMMAHLSIPTIWVS